MQGVRQASAVEIDWTKCFGYERLIAEEIGHYSAIEVTEELKEGGLAANPSWLRWYRFLADTWRTDFGSEIVAAAKRVPATRLLSLGCGYGGMEIEAAQRLQALGLDYEILALDVNQALFHSARQQVEREGLRVRFEALDLNFLELEENAFDVVFAHASLHHLLNYEHVFAQVHRGLRDGGRFVVLDIIGKTQVLFWPENIGFATKVVEEMPQRYRRRLDAEPAELFVHHLDGAEQQGMEGIRQEDLEEQITRLFRPVLSFKYNAFVRLICTHHLLAPLFDPTRREDTDYLDSLFRLDLEQVEAGGLRATEMFAVFEKRPDREVAAAGRPGAERRVSVVLRSSDAPDDGDLLGTCLESVLAQDHRHLELLVLLHAARRDAVSEEVTRRVGGRAEVRFVEPGVDGGRGLASAVQAASGDYVALIDSRDTWYPIKLSQQVAVLERDPERAATAAQALVVDERGRRTSRVFGTDVVGGEAGASSGDEATIPRSSLLLRRTAWEQAAPREGEGLDEAELARRLVARQAVAFQQRPLGMLRAPRTAADAGDAVIVGAVALPAAAPPPIRARPELLRRIVRRLMRTVRRGSAR